MLDQAYKDHQVLQQLGKYSEFYESLSMSVFGFATLGTKSACNIDSYVYSSIKGTLESISLVLSAGRISDAYALLRRYYDSAIINIYSNLYLKDKFSIENFVVKQIHDWLHGKQRLPEYRKMSAYIRSSPQLKPLNDLLYSTSTYKDIRARCNDFTHYNYYSNVLLNDNQVFLKDRIAVLDRFSKDLENILVLHLSYLFCLNEHYMMSSDYIDHLECGLTPPQDSEYLVAPFVQRMFDSVIKKSRLDIAKEIKKITAMNLE
jgi:hypothetical protein